MKPADVHPQRRDFFKVLQATLLRRGLSLAAFGREIGISKATLSELLRGRRVGGEVVLVGLTLDTARTLARGMELSLDALAALLDGDEVSVRDGYRRALVLTLAPVHGVGAVDVADAILSRMREGGVSQRSGSEQGTQGR